MIFKTWLITIKDNIYSEYIEEQRQEQEQGQEQGQIQMNIQQSQNTVHQDNL